MSLLAPLYFLGALAIGLPILFHLIRRQPKGEVEFSSLMFLKPTPPRLTRRSRLENLPLLLIRALALILLAAAFARPFLRQSASSDFDGLGRRIVIALDTSASMQRADLWQQAKSIAANVISDIQPGDRISVIGFDEQPTTLFSFDQSAQLTPTQMEASATKVINDLSPTWKASDLGRAISFAADLAVTHEGDDQLENASTPSTAKTLAGPAHLVFITDMQKGNKIESLQVFAWPDELNLDVRVVTTNKTTNAWAKIMSPSESSADQEEDNRIRVRVSNTSDANSSQFRLCWKTADGSLVTESTMPVQVPPGESRVVPMPPPRAGVTALSLLDDDHPFDNDTFFTTQEPVSQTLLYIGNDADPKVQIEPKDSLFFYLSRVPLSNRFRRVTIDAIGDHWPESIDPKKTPFVTMARGISQNQALLLKDYVHDGGRVLTVFSSTDQTSPLLASLREITGASKLAASEADVEDYVMLSKIKFRHPMFASMADPQFNDFTKIRFWQHRTLTGVPESWNVLAAFDDGEPALLEVPMDGRGKFWILTTGWQPESSQLALSTKFIPLVFQWFSESSSETRQVAGYTLGEKIDLNASPAAKITGPDQMTWSYNSDDNLTNIDRPGLYSYVDGNDSQTFAVNIAESESHTETLDGDVLERFGVKLGSAPTAEQFQDAGRQLRDIELEGRQKLWQWLLVVGLVLLLLESWLGGRISRTNRTAPV